MLVIKLLSTRLILEAAVLTFGWREGEATSWLGKGSCTACWKCRRLLACSAFCSACSTAALGELKLAMSHDLALKGHPDFTLVDADTGRYC